MEESYVRLVELLGFEKRFFPSQHYVYMLMVKWSDLSEKIIYRTYPEFHTFHKSLKEMFPIEAGQIEKKDRIIPKLPAPRWLDSEKSTETRQSTLSDYCSLLINLRPHISRCKLLTVFFSVRPEDENPPAPNTLKRNENFVESRELVRGNASEISGPIILDTYRVVADFEKTSKHEIALHAGDQVEIVEKNQNGWWFCQCESKRGWVPAAYLEPLDTPEEAEEAEPNYEGELHVAIKAYKAEQEDEISLELGQTIEVIHKLLDGWWVVRKGDETGHVPSMFLHKAGKKEIYEAERLNIQRQKPPPRRSSISNAKSIHNKARQKISQDTYRRNSRRYLQQKGGLRVENKNSRGAAKSPLRERKNQENIPKQSASSSEGELKKDAPVVPPRPSAELILERCSDNTRKRVSFHGSEVKE
ncbi:neutrophil cytosol factor 1 [Labrus bergylta]|uniref:Neutrophil cytosolic factor 1 n=1 Tax=Labrus bergylta TaxID=56723 RepID=A0A3Q3MP59_9LABR|nr:neutrophil cytosol factor 1-like [Labrus bergylta]XP_020511159.1 neutrophil cytosol factor 1-like [Labrus bergylta]